MVATRLNEQYRDEMTEKLIAAISEKRPVADLRLVIRQVVGDCYMDGYNYGLQKGRGKI